jgi:acid phosphatase type 7
MRRRDAVKGILAAAAAPWVGGCLSDRLLAPSLSTGSIGGGVTLIGAGDLHAASTAVLPRKRTAAMVKAALDAEPGAMAFMVGDLTHTGKTAEYTDFYAPSWGAFRDRTIFCIGNHDTEYADPPGAAYYTYTKAPRYFAADLGDHWRAYSLNCSLPGTEQADWLRADLAAHPDRQYLAMFHYPMFSSVCEYHTALAGHPKDMTWKAKVGPWWKILQAAGCEFALSGHAHRFERLAPMLADGTASANGIRQYVVGTAGVKLRGIVTEHPRSEKIVVAHGVVKFGLYPDHYEWIFTDEFGAVRDQGTQVCHRILA